MAWVIPKGEESEHPPSDVKVGQQYIVSLINAIMESKYWPSTAIFVTWDDYGGWYDHVPPPQIDAFGLGFRVPCLVISPYAKEGLIDHTQTDFCSILKFMETIHNLPSLTQRDVIANNMMEAFDFSQPPRPTLILPGSYIPDHYPLTLKETQTYAQSSAKTTSLYPPAKERQNAFNDYMRAFAVVAIVAAILLGTVIVLRIEKRRMRLNRDRVNSSV